MVSALNIHQTQFLFLISPNVIFESSLPLGAFRHGQKIDFSLVFILNVSCTIRRDLPTRVNDIMYQYGFSNLSNEELLQIILYGHGKLPYDSNAKILSMTIQYIHDSKRFDRMTTNNFSECS